MEPYARAIVPSEAPKKTDAHESSERLLRQAEITTMAAHPGARLRRWWAPLVLVGCASLSRWTDFRSFTSPDAIRPDFDRAARMSLEELADRYSVRFAPLGYKPEPASGLECIQKHPQTALDDVERRLLDQNGFVVSRDRPYGTFALAYLSLYKQDQPIFITADAILHAWHRAYDDMLVNVERIALRGFLQRFLEGMRRHVSSTGASPAVQGYLDTYLTVAQGLLEDRVLEARSGGSTADVGRFHAMAKSASGFADVPVFGSTRTVDFSQFTPRGHYEKHPDLIPYFRSMMWLGTVDFRPIETTPAGQTVFHREQFDAMVAAREAMEAETFDLWRAIDQLVGFFVGMRDAMSPDQVESLARDIGARDPRALYGVPDADVERTFRQSNYGKQQIGGHPYAKLPGVAELPLNRSFAIFGQRYSLDSHALHAVTEDRVPGRDLPTSRDVAFATLANDFALQLAAPSDRASKSYAAGLATMRVLSDAQHEAYWQSSLYSSWIWALRALSAAPEDHWRRARVTRTEGWARRLLATQLASWSELRHDTILYAKQSYSVSVLCEYPDAFVDPYPEFFRRLVKQSEMGRAVVSDIQRFADTAEQGQALKSAESYFVRAREILAELERMADESARGEHLSPEQLSFVNRMIDQHSSGSRGCGGGVLTYDGWYRDLLNGANVWDPDPTVADVHTGHTGILHVGKQRPRRIVVTIDWPDGVHAYIGAAFSFHEVVAQKRLTDSEWAQTDLPDPWWLAPILAHARP
jgi:hypothetical protein